MTHKIKIITLAMVLGISGTAIAAGEGLFMGLGVGATKTNYPSKTVTAVTNDVVETASLNSTTTGAGARLLFGYNFNSYAAWEAGFTAYGSTSYKIPASYGLVGSTPEIHTNVIDLLVKGSVPFFSSGLEAFIKGGLAIVRISQSKSLYAPNASQVISCQSTAGTSPQLCGGSGTPSIYARPEVAFGVSYDFTPKWEVTGSYSQVVKGGPVPSLSFASVQVSYHWVDVYCGQFLC